MRFFVYKGPRFGEVVERLMAPVLKTYNTYTNPIKIFLYQQVKNFNLFQIYLHMSYTVSIVEGI